MSAPQLLGEQVAIITGGVRGIGLAIAEAMLAHGGSVLVADIDGEAAGRRWRRWRRRWRRKVQTSPRFRVM